MDLNEFRTQILDDMHYEASSNRTSPQEEFCAFFARELINADEFEDFEQISYEGVGLRRRMLRIDGYCYSEMENCLYLVICPFSDSQEIQTLSATTAEIHFNHVQAFYEDACSGFIQKYAEESSPGYGLAFDIFHKYQNVAKIKFYLLTDMVMSNRIKEIPSKQIGSAVAEYHIWDIARLKDLEESKTGKEDITINLKQFSLRGIPCLAAGSNDDYAAYLCSMPGSILASLYNTYGGRLLEGNVRSFLGVKGRINKEIRKTILVEPDMFFAYNNGIAATASSVKLEKGEGNLFITEITALQIVNGGQTTASLAASVLNDKDKVDGLRKIYVPMKLSVVSPAKATELIPNIAKCANKQNKVSDADFFSNSPFHIRIEGFSRRIIAPAINGNQFGTHWYYERARGQYRQDQAKLTPSEKRAFLERNPKAQMFTKTDLAKYYNAYLQFPYQVCEGAQKNFVHFADWATREWEKSDTEFNEDFFKRLVCLAIIFKKVDWMVKGASWYSLGYKAQVVTYTISYLFFSIEKQADGATLDFRLIWANQDISSALEQQLGIIAEQMYKLLVSDKREVQNVTEWAKRSSCWEHAKLIDIPLSSSVKDGLVSRIRSLEDHREARKEQRLQNQAEYTIQVVNYGVSKWKAVKDWGVATHIFNPVDISFLNIAIAIERGRIPTDKQSCRIMQVLEKAHKEGFIEKT